jgi:hypothetical protein
MLSQVLNVMVSELSIHVVLMKKVLEKTIQILLYAIETNVLDTLDVLTYINLLL